MFFSDYFRELDKKSIVKIHDKLTESKYFIKIQEEWQKPLEKKRIRRQRKLENPIIPKEDEPEPSLYVHNPEEGVQVPPNPN